MLQRTVKCWLNKQHTIKSQIIRLTNFKVGYLCLKDMHLFMKKGNLLTIAMILLFSTAAIAQKNTWMIYGNAAYDNENYTNNANNPGVPGTPVTLVSWNVSPGIGYQFSNHFMIGVEGGYGKQDGIEPSYPGFYGSGKNTSALWQAGLFGRYTSWLGKRFFVYTQLSATKYSVDVTSGYSGSTIPYGYPNNPEMPDGNGFMVTLFPAVGVNILQGFGVHIDIGGISYSTFNAFTTLDQHHFNITLGRQFSFGIHKIIGWKKFNPVSKQIEWAK